MANGIPDLALHGKDVTLTIFVGKTPLADTDNCQSVDIREVNTQHVDKLLGRPADRLDETPGHWELDYGGMYPSAKIVLALMAQKAARAANQPFDEISVGMVYTNRDGSQSAYIFSKCTTNMNIKVGGKDDAVMQSFKIQAETFAPQDL
jgi:hypothetical protein